MRLSQGSQEGFEVSEWHHGVSVVAAGWCAQAELAFVNTQLQVPFSALRANVNYMSEEDNAQSRYSVQSYDPETPNPDNCKQSTY